jgi:TonB family protein
MRKACLAVLAALALTGVVIAEEAEVVEPFVIADSHVAPEYPPAAEAARFEGVVAVAAMINADGSVGAVEVIEGTGTKLGFDEAAVDAVKQWRFSPAQVNGEAVDSVSAYIFRFYIPGGRAAGGFVNGDFVTSQIGSIGGVGVGTGPGAKPGVSRGPGSGLLVETVKSALQKVKKAPECMGCLYDRRDLIPPKNTGYDGPNVPRSL